MDDEGLLDEAGVEYSKKSVLSTLQEEVRSSTWLLVPSCVACAWTIAFGAGNLFKQNAVETPVDTVLFTGLIFMGVALGLVNASLVVALRSEDFRKLDRELQINYKYDKFLSVLFRISPLLAALWCSAMLAWCFLASSIPFARFDLYPTTWLVPYGFFSFGCMWISAFGPWRVVLGHAKELMIIMVKQELDKYTKLDSQNTDWCKVYADVRQLHMKIVRFCSLSNFGFLFIIELACAATSTVYGSLILLSGIVTNATSLFGTFIGASIFFVSGLGFVSVLYKHSEIHSLFHAKQPGCGSLFDYAENWLNQDAESRASIMPESSEAAQAGRGQTATEWGAEQPRIEHMRFMSFLERNTISTVLLGVCITKDLTISALAKLIVQLPACYAALLAVLQVNTHTHSFLC